jgi:hypothetical protein
MSSVRVPDSTRFFEVHRPAGAFAAFSREHIDWILFCSIARTPRWQAGGGFNVLVFGIPR